MILGLDWPLALQLLILGCFTGFLAGLLGIGGGMLLVPFMTLILSAQGVPAASRCPPHRSATQTPRW